VILAGNNSQVNTFLLVVVELGFELEVSLEPHLQVILLWFFWRRESLELFGWAGLQL
jgi:hypothetical protein